MLTQHHESTPDAATSDAARAAFDAGAADFAQLYDWFPPFQERYRLCTAAIDGCLADEPAGALCFDMGCGGGTFTRYMAARGQRVVAVDASPQMLAVARREAASQGLAGHIDFHEQNLPLDETFVREHQEQGRLVFCSSVLEYVADYRRALEQFQRLTAPGGWLVLTLPNRAALARRIERGQARWCAPRGDYGAHRKHHFNLRRTCRELAGVGYDVVDQQYFALPWHRFTAPIFGGYRGRWLATLFMIVGRKR